MVAGPPFAVQEVLEYTGGEAKQISGMDSTALREQASVCIAILGSKADNTSCLSSIVPRM
jgi:hypothetical protein